MADSVINYGQLSWKELNDLYGYKTADSTIQSSMRGAWLDGAIKRIGMPEFKKNYEYILDRFDKMGVPREELYTALERAEQQNNGGKAGFWKQLWISGKGGVRQGVNLLESMPSAIADAQAEFNEMLPGQRTGIYNDYRNNAWRRMAERNKTTEREDYENNVNLQVWDHLKKGDFGKAAQGALNSFVRGMVHQGFQYGLQRAIGPLGTVAMGIAVQQEKMADWKYNGDRSIPEWQARTTATLNGIWEAVFEHLGTEKIFDKMKMGNTNLAEAFLTNPSVKNLLQSAAKDILVNFVTEGGEEFVTEIAQEVTDRLGEAHTAEEFKAIAMDTLKNHMGEILNQATEAFIQGGMIGAGASGVDVALNGRHYYKVIKTEKASRTTFNQIMGMKAEDRMPAKYATQEQRNAALKKLFDEGEPITVGEPTEEERLGALQFAMDVMSGRGVDEKTKGGDGDKYRKLREKYDAIMQPRIEAENAAREAELRAEEERLAEAKDSLRQRYEKLKERYGAFGDSSFRNRRRTGADGVDLLEKAVESGDEGLFDSTLEKLQPELDKWQEKHGQKAAPAELARTEQAEEAGVEQGEERFQMPPVATAKEVGVQAATKSESAELDAAIENRKEQTKRAANAKRAKEVRHETFAQAVEDVKRKNPGFAIKTYANSKEMSMDKAVISRLRAALGNIASTLTDEEIADRVEAANLNDGTGAVVVNEAILNNGDYNYIFNKLNNHEIGVHSGLSLALGGERYNKLMNQIFNERESDVKSMMSRFNYKFKYDTDKGRADAAEEYLARVSERGVQRPSWWREFISQVRQILRDLGFNVKVTDSDIEALLRKGQRAAQRMTFPTRTSQNAKPSTVSDAQQEYDAVVKQYRGTDKWMKAPNGKPTNLDERQWVQVRTPSFKNWFGDWENDPENASKVVDENGEPLVAQHGDRYDAEYTIYDESETEYHGFWTWLDTQKDNDYADQRKLLVFLNARNPIVIKDIDIAKSNQSYYDIMAEFKSKGIDIPLEVFGIEEKEINNEAPALYEFMNDIIPIIKSIGFDSIIINEQGRRSAAVFQSNQIKSATDNVGSFDGENPDIRFSLVEDPKLKRRLDSEKTEKVYRAMLEIDGKLYPPMASVQDGKLVDPVQMGEWYKSDVPDINEMLSKGQMRWNGKKLEYHLVKGDGGTPVWAAYNPYWHTSNSMLNDQFSAAYQRNLVVVECEVPVSENEGDYDEHHEQYAKNRTGWTNWHSGQVATWIAAAKGEQRDVFLSRYIKMNRVVEPEEVARNVMDTLDGTNVRIPTNVVSVKLRQAIDAEAKARGVESPMFETITADGKFSTEEFTALKDAEMRNLKKAKPRNKDIVSQRIAESVGETKDPVAGMFSEAVVSDEPNAKLSTISTRYDMTHSTMMSDLVDKHIMTEDQAKEFRRNVNGVIEKLEKALKKNPFLDIDVKELLDENGRPIRQFLPIKDNSDPLYQLSLDFSTLCKKRVFMQNVVEFLQKKLDRVMTAEEQVAIRQMLLEYRKQNEAIQVACHLCYVEAARLQAAKWQQAFIDPENRVSRLKNYLAQHDNAFNSIVREKIAKFKRDHGYDSKATKKQMSGKDVDQMEKLAIQWRQEYRTDNPEYLKALKDIETIPNSYFLSAEGLVELKKAYPLIYDAFTADVRTRSRSKALETDVSYLYGDLKNARKNPKKLIKLIKQLNEQGTGFRHQSWSDFQIKHLLDTIVAICDFSVNDSKMHAYTKRLAFARCFGKTGMMINLSLIPNLNGNGWSSIEGIDYNDALKAREMFPETCGTIAIAMSPEHLLKLMSDPTVDYIIPYHTSNMPTDARLMLRLDDWTDFQNFQHEKNDADAAKQDGVKNWHKAPELNEWLVKGEDGYAAMEKSQRKYLDLCKERGLLPKFAEVEGLMTRDADGNWQAPAGYWKVLIDHKMVNHKNGKLIEQQVVKPVFDFSEINKVIDEEIAADNGNNIANATQYVYEQLFSNDEFNQKKMDDLIRTLKDKGEIDRVLNAGKKRRNILPTKETKTESTAKLALAPTAAPPTWETASTYKAKLDGLIRSLNIPPLPTDKQITGIVDIDAPGLVAIARELSAPVSASDDLGPGVLGMFRYGREISIKVLRDLAKRQQLTQTLKVPTKDYPSVVQQQRAYWSQRLHCDPAEIEFESKQNSNNGTIFNVYWTDPSQSRVRKVLGHEVGHLFDWTAEHTTRSTGVLGTLLGAHKYAMDFLKAYNGSLYAKNTITRELTELTRWWSGDWTKASEKYRTSPQELYAEAFSVLFCAPDEFRARCPETWAMIQEFQQKRPEAMQAWEDMMVAMTNPSLEGKLLDQLLDEDREKAEANAKKVTPDPNDSMYSSQLEKFVAMTRRNYQDKFVDIVNLVKRKGLNYGGSPLPSILEMTHMSSVQEYMREMNRLIDRTDLPEEYIDRMLKWHRIAYDPNLDEKVKSLGITAETAKSRIELEKKDDPDSYAKFQAFHKEFWNLRKKGLIALAKRVGAYSGDLLDKLENNEWYATKLVADFVGEEGSHIGTPDAFIHELKGSIEGGADALFATLNNDATLMAALLRNEALLKTIDLVKQEGWAKKTRAVGPSMYAKPDKGWTQLTVLRDGKLEHWDVVSNVGDAFVFKEMWPVAKQLGVAMGWYRWAWTRVRPSFWATNAIRDATSSYYNLPDDIRSRFDLATWTEYYIKGVNETYKYLFTENGSQLVEGMMWDNYFMTSHSWGDYDVTEGMLENLRKKYGVSKKQKGGLARKVYDKTKGFASDVSNMIEMSSKVAAELLLRERSNLTDAERRRMVVEQMGSPDFAKGGKYSRGMNALFTFFNANVQGMAQSLEAMADHPMAYGKRVMQTMGTQIMLQTILSIGASLIPEPEDKDGILHWIWDKLRWTQRMYRKLSKWQYDNYFVVPVKELPDGRCVFFRMPYADTLKPVQNAIKDVIAHSVGSAYSSQRSLQSELGEAITSYVPEVTPVGMAIGHIMALMAGYNPRDMKTGMPIVDEKAFKAGGLTALFAILIGIWNEDLPVPIRLPTKMEAENMKQFGENIGLEIMGVQGVARIQDSEKYNIKADWKKGNRVRALPVR